MANTDAGQELKITADDFFKQQKMLADILEKSLNVSSVPQSSAVIPAPGQFSFKSEDWEDWKTSFARYRRTALAAYSSEQQVDYFIGLLGIKAEKILKSFHLSGIEIVDIDKVIENFDRYFGQSKNLVYERVKFLQRVQKADEPCDVFINDLTTLSQTCEWATLESEMIKLRLIAGLSDSRLSVQLQARPSDTLEEVIKRVRLAETLRQQQTVVRSSAPAPSLNPTAGSAFERETVEVSELRRAQNRFKNKQSDSRYSGGRHFSQKDDNSNNEQECRKCGKAPRHAFINCPAKDDTCLKCGNKGHWQIKCRSTNTKSSSNKSYSNSSAKIATVVENPIPTGGEDDIFFLGSVEKTKSTPWRVSVLISGVPVNFKVDTGADVTVLRSDTFATLGQKIKLLAPEKPLLSASGDIMHVLGTFNTSLQWRNQKHTTTIYVAKKLHENLLGRDTVELLGMLTWAGAVNIVEDFQDVFEGIGNLGNLYNIKLRDGVRPFAISTPRRVAIHLREAVKEHLDMLEKSSVIKKITEPTAWCAPMVVVPKKDKKVRICVDYTMINKSVESERLVLPEIMETLALIDPEAKYFSKLDATSGFYHVPLTEESQLLTTFITPFGRYAFTRLPMGITSATERFQREMFDTLEGLEGVVNVADDSLVFGRTKEEHDERLQLVLKRFRERGLKLNQNKCIFGVPKLIFLGHVVSKDGVSIDPEKLQAIHKMPEPTDVSGVRKLLGCIQMHAKFIPNLADIASPLQLLNKNSEFCWSDPQKQAFLQIKQALTTAPILSHFAPGRPTRVGADASSYGLGAVLEQKNGDLPWRPVCYASRTLSDTEKRYAQVEKEALASTWACEKFKQYLIGQTFLILTDHKPLVELLGQKPISDLPARIQRFRMRLMQFSYTVEYIPGKEMMMPDLLSRSPIESTDIGTDALLIDEVQIFEEHVTKSLPILEPKLAQIRQAQQSDEQCTRLKNFIKSGWPKNVRDLLPEDRSFFDDQGKIVI